MGNVGSAILNVLLLHLDGKLPNLALMRLAAHYRGNGDTVTLRRADNPKRIDTVVGDQAYWDVVYGSLIFERSRPIAEHVKALCPDAILGGTGWNLTTTLEDVRDGLSDGPLDYSDYPEWQQSIGFTQRGCRLSCKFCVVPAKEGKVREVATVDDIYRGAPWPRQLVLLDNDFFGQPHWRDRVDEIRRGRFKVNFCQGINARKIDDEIAAAIASVDYRDTKMDRRRIYTAWDNARDEAALFGGLERLVRHGVRPSHVMVYMLVGYWRGAQLNAEDFHRHRRLREFGALPYPMPFVRTRELVGFQRWIVGAYDKRVPWAEWEAAEYEPRRLQRLPEAA